MTPDELASAIKEYAREAYPEMEVRVEDPGPHEPDGQRRIYFTEPMFAALYPLQRFHYLVHLFPREFYEEELEHTDWFELAPGEDPDDLVYPDDDKVEAMVDHVLENLNKAGFFELMDDVFSPIDPDTEPAECYGDFRHMQRILAEVEFTERERFDAAHVLMHQGAYCDCEVLFNLAPKSRTTLRGADTHGDGVHEH
jgi:hypothetical protein